MGTLIRAYDWSKTSLGPPEAWPHALKTALSILLNSKHQMFMAWGPGLISFYNDAYRPVLGARHPDALGRPFPEIWADVWPAIGPLVDRALAGEGTWSENLPLVTFRNGFQEIANFTFSYSPIFDDSGEVAGMFCACTETTDKILRESPKCRRANAFRANEGLLHSLFQQAPGFMAVVRGPDHVFEMANAAYQQLIGFRPVIGKPFREALPEIDVQGFTCLLDQVYVTGQPYIGRGHPALVQSTPGEPAALRHVDFIFQPIAAEDGSVSGIFIQGHDVTDHKRTEAALAESEDRYRALLEASTMVFWTATPDGEFAQVSGWNRLSGEHEDQHSAEGWLDTLHPEDRECAIAQWLASVISGASYQAEFRVRHRGGEYRWASARAVPLKDSNGSIREWVGTLADIHDQKQIEEALRASEERLRLAVETTALGIWDVDLSADRHEWTPETRQILGIAADAPLTGETFLSCIHPEDRARMETVFYDDRSDTGSGYRSVCRIIRADNGEERWAAATGQTIYSETGQPIRKLGTIRDITEHKRSEETLHATVERLRLALSAGRMIAWEQDLATNHVTRSQNAFGLLGIGSGPLSEFLDRVHPEDRPLREHFHPRSGTTGSDTIEFRYTLPNGKMLWLGLRGEKAGPDRLVGVTFDITDRKESEAKIWRVANHDALTGLPNRALFQQRLEQALADAKQNGTAVSLLLIDFDHFKEINDALGHDAGDAFLRETAHRLKALMRDCDTVARFSGDEFAVLVVEPLRLEHASRLAGIMSEKLSEPFRYLGRAIASKASIGVAAFPEHDATPADLLKDADIALFEAKAQGRSRVVTYCPTLRSAVEQRVSLLEEVREILPKGQIVPFYQPKICLSSGAIIGFEVLARWRHPERGILSPDYFGAAFDDPRLAIALSESLLTKAVSDLRQWLDAGLDPGRVAFNLSACEFSQPGLTDHVFRILDAAQIPSENFEVEVTETVLLSQNAGSISATLNSFHSRGISVALDDFGTGYASLTHLKRFPVSHIKIDRGFVMNLEQDAGDKAIVEAIISLGRNLGMQITAEGVETLGQAQRLRELGCHNAQGYFYSKPVESGQVPDFLRD
ncbi:EAL domain-containing protein [Microvirga sp. 17 mud 1-3]|uniref:sensor domain-containing protein n=1 Tax=Microvirga sp. 17 mud 1-3 TaxID=2082949 RepID=UPI000D6C6163|nr:EAL domain-containing protein [Microvirga sp. 17 mud 1-3]AWM86790.1 hypothetical protein C4E04_08685 [Microvirga sp. 17 mud 1-3]